MGEQLVLPWMGLTLPELVDTAVKTLQTFAPSDDRPYCGCFSGGKDSVVIKELARIAGVSVAWHYNVTTIDPPELVRFIKREHADVTFERPKHGNFFVRMEKVNGFPTRRARWCCAEYKESYSPEGARLIFGIRAEESPRRAAAWGITKWHNKTREYAISPIFYWPATMVWKFIRETGIPYCSLYDEGWKRLGCIGCPMAGREGKARGFKRWPGFERRWKLSFQRIWDRRTGSLQRGGRIWFGDKYFRGWQEMWEWWLHEAPLPEESCQGVIDLLQDGSDE